MSFSLPQLLLLMVAYLSVLFAVGFAAERGLLPKRLLEHPVVYVLSLGVFSGAMGIFGASEMAAEYGYSFLFYYAGIVSLFLLSPLLLHPLMQLSRSYQLGSIADLLSFRFQSPGVGSMVTLMLLASILPLLALQIQAVGTSIDYLLNGGAAAGSSGRSDDTLALIFCFTIAIFTMLFGSRSPSSQPRHQGLVATIAFESLIKLLGLLILGTATVYSVFDGFGGLEQWLDSRPDIMATLTTSMRPDSARAMLLIFFAGAVNMPHLYHMTFAENPNRGYLRHASWGLPLYLLLLAIPIMPILWASMALESTLPPGYAILATGMLQDSVLLSTIAFMVGLSAGSAVIIVGSLALANMCLNHLVLPLRFAVRKQLPDRVDNVYEQLTWLRRVLAAAIVLLGYGCYQLLRQPESLVDTGLVAFTGSLQFLPAIFAAIYWPRANRAGLLAGLGAGFGIWFFALLLPSVTGMDASFIDNLYLLLIAEPDNRWSTTAIISLALNISLFILVSLLTPSRDRERSAAAACSVNDLDPPRRSELLLSNPAEYREALAVELGPRLADQQINRALAELDMAEDESRPLSLRRLRVRLTANLSGLLGPSMAAEIIHRCIPLRSESTSSPTDINLIERNLDRAQSSFTGVLAELDTLRRHHKETLRELPVGVLSLGEDGEILMWNRFMEQLTGAAADDVVGSLLHSVPVPWSDLLQSFAETEEHTVQRLPLEQEMPDTEGTQRWISLHKTAIASPNRDTVERIITVEDITQYQLLEQELLHSERLASIGRLAAGVAHEIGNPVTGIACLAQNLEYEKDLAEVHNSAGEILKQTDRVTRIVESLVNFSHTGKNNPAPTRMGPVNVADCVDEAINLLQLDRNAREVRYNNHCDREHLALADSQKMLQVFINLLSNARDASADGQTIDIESHGEADRMRIDVTDQGGGIPESIREQIFEPFFTTKDPGEGTGLGLSLVYSILEDMNGRIQLLSPSSDTGGTRFTVTLAQAEYSQDYL